MYKVEVVFHICDLFFDRRDEEQRGERALEEQQLAPCTRRK